MNAREFFKKYTGTTPIIDEKFTTEYLLKFAEAYAEDNYFKKPTEKKKHTSVRYMDTKDTFFFGKYKGESLSDILDVDEDYIKWCLDNFEGFCVTRKAAGEIESEIGRGYVVPKTRVEKSNDTELPF